MVCHVAAAGNLCCGGTDREGRDSLLGVMGLGQARTPAAVTSVHLAEVVTLSVHLGLRSTVQTVPGSIVN